MHEPVCNEVPVPVEAVERALRQYAIPGFTGRRTLYLRVKPEAGLLVEVIPETVETQRMNERPANISPENVFAPGQPTERELIIRQLLLANAYRFRLGMKVSRIICDFRDGALQSAQWVSVG